MTTSATTPTTESIQIPLDRIPTDDKAQTRVAVRAAVVRDYAAAMTGQLAEGGLRFPPVILFTDGTDYWLGDGFHRVLAARKAGLTEIAADVRAGTQRDAVLFGISANAAHGLPRTKADQRHAVRLMLADPEWSQWSDREIGRRCQVDHTAVNRIRRSASGALHQIGDRKVRRGNKVFAMNVAAINAANKEPTPPVLPPDTAVTPTTDTLGLPLPTWSAPVFAAVPAFQKALDLFDRLAEVIDEISQDAGGEVYRQELVRTTNNGRLGFACPALRAARNKLALAAPYCGYCPSCHAVQPGRPNPRCKKCSGRGWTTRAGWESCADGDRKGVLKMGAGKG